MPKVNYDAISKIYDDVRTADTDLINSLMECVAISADTQILDIGCGTGNHTDLFQRISGARVCGVEPSAGMLDKARAKNSAVEFRQGDAAHLPFEDSVFDLVYMTDVIHHVPDINAMFVEVYRVLRFGGKICIVTQSHAQIERRPIVRFFPGTAAVDKARYPKIDGIIHAGEANGLCFLKTAIFSESETIMLDSHFADLIRKKGYSMLHLIAEDEYVTGLQALEVALQDGPINARSAGESLVWLEKKTTH